MMLSKLIKSVIFLKVVSLVFVATVAQANSSIPYYGDDFYNDLNSGVSGLDLQLRLQKVLRGMHIERPGQNDEIVSSCGSVKGRCYGQYVIGYKAARIFLMSNYYVVKTDSGYAVRDLYCSVNRNVGKIGPRDIPDNKVINVEHTWPQSRFNRAFPKDMQKSDLHHLFPTDSRINAIRGNNVFGEVSSDSQHLSCAGPRFGVGSAGSRDVFEPPQIHKGNVARALFYFSIRYDLKISTDEEVILKKWNQEDPVDAEEMARNEEIFKLQNNRNPFIDFPELATRISDF